MSNINNRLLLRRFTVGGDWSQLFRRLGWQSVGDGLYNDGESEVTLDASPDADIKIGFVLRPNEKEDGMEESGPRRISPSGLLPEIKRMADCPSTVKSKKFLMNHAALRIQDENAERIWYEEFLGKCTVLARSSTWDPVARTFWPDAHLFRSPDFYLTLRGGFEYPCVDHVGWMTDSIDSVEEAANILGDLQWPILFGPAYIDGSYLVHFRGPDSRVHDFFFPTEAIRIPKEESWE